MRRELETRKLRLSARSELAVVAAVGSRCGSWQTKRQRAALDTIVPPGGIRCMPGGSRWASPPGSLKFATRHRPQVSADLAMSVVGANMGSGGRILVIAGETQRQSVSRKAPLDCGSGDLARQTTWQVKTWQVKTCGEDLRQIAPGEAPVDCHVCLTLRIGVRRLTSSLPCALEPETRNPEPKTRNQIP